MPRDFRAVYHYQVNDDGSSDLLAVVGLTDWTEHSCMLHIASDGTGRWASPKFFYECYRYMFGTCGLTSVYAIAAFDNPKAVALHRKLGHRELCVMRHYAGLGKHAYLFTLTVEDWATSKWNKDSAAFAATSLNSPIEREASQEDTTSGKTKSTGST